MTTTPEVPQGRPAGRAWGLVIFIAGLAMLAAVFVLAAEAAADFSAALADPVRSVELGVGQILATAAARAGFLLVMTLAASLFAAKGLDLYRASAQGEKS
jgi:hypothetical protein